jgi:hypothetical protein
VTFFLLDTNTAQDFSHRRHGIVERADLDRRRGNRLGICTPVLGELWAGVEASDTRDKNLPRLLAALSRSWSGPTRTKLPRSTAASSPSLSTEILGCLQTAIVCAVGHLITVTPSRAGGMWQGWTMRIWQVRLPDTLAHVSMCVLWLAQTRTWKGFARGSHMLIRVHDEHMTTLGLVPMRPGFVFAGRLRITPQSPAPRPPVPRLSGGDPVLGSGT